MNSNMKKAFKENKNAGYTLIEVVVVAVIIIILSVGAVISFSSYSNSRIDSASQKLLLALSQARQEAIIRAEASNRADGSVRMELTQDLEGNCYAQIIYDSTSNQVLEEYLICNSRIKLSIKTASTPPEPPTPTPPPVITQLTPTQPIIFNFKKSTGGIIENYTDLILEGSETRNIIIIRETGRCYEP